MAAMLAGMCHGIEGQLDPGPPVVGNGYDAAPKVAPTVAAMPRHWFDAVDQFAASSLLKDYLGETFVDMFAIVKRTEQDRYFATVPTLDYDWYLRTA
jgi:glutamine synthetase